MHQTFFLWLGAKPHSSLSGWLRLLVGCLSAFRNNIAFDKGTVGLARVYQLQQDRVEYQKLLDVLIRVCFQLNQHYCILCPHVLSDVFIIIYEALKLCSSLDYRIIDLFQLKMKRWWQIILVDSLGLRTLRFTFKGSSIVSAACLHILDDLSEYFPDNSLNPSNRFSSQQCELRTIHYLVRRRRNRK